MEKLLGTQEVAKICQVAQGTVIRWIKEGRLPASATAGGHHRIHLNDLVHLLRDLRLPVPAELSSEGQARILIVDDETEVRNMIRWMLEQDFKNILIEEAKEGFSAGWKTHSFLPDLVILDLMFPGLDGFYVCQFIRQFVELQHTKIIAISALGDPEVEKKILSLGADVFLRKPFDLDILKKTIRDLLNEHKKNQERAPVHQTPKRILIVEDSEDNKALMQLFLKKTSHAVEFAENGAVAVEKATTKKYDLIFMDMNMPVMGGLEASRAIREWEKKQGGVPSPVPIVALTADAIEESFQKALDAGCSAYLTKPVKKILFLEAISKYGGNGETLNKAAHG